MVDGVWIVECDPIVVCCIPRVKAVQDARAPAHLLCDTRNTQSTTSTISTCTGGYQPVPTPGCSTYIEYSYDSYYELVHSMKKYYCANIILDYWWYGYELVDITRYLDLPPVYFLGAMAWLT